VEEQSIEATVAQTKVLLARGGGGGGGGGGGSESLCVLEIACVQTRHALKVS